MPERDVLHGHRAVGGGLDDLPPLSTFTFAVRLSGSAWRVQRTGQFDTLAALSCARSTQCQAVGSFVTKLDNTQAMGQSWNGHAWRITKPRGLPFELTDISCTSVTFCMAVGGHASATWNGRAWNSVRTHASGGAGFSQLSCRSRSFCLALGGTDGSEVWTGSLWRDVATVVPLHATTSGLTGLSCTRSTYCMAVGEFTLDQHGGVNHTLAEVWNGIRWRILRSPDPAPNSVFNAVSCVLGSGCMAVGNDVDAENAGHNVAARWNGTSWRVLPMPGGNGFGSVGINGTTGPVAVSCPNAGSCMAVGSYFDGAVNLGFNLALTWNGHTWRQTRTAGPAGGLADVSCSAAGHCVAVGQAGTLTLAERWNGKTWARLKSFNP